MYLSSNCQSIGKQRRRQPNLQAYLKRSHRSRSMVCCQWRCQCHAACNGYRSPQQQESYVTKTTVSRNPYVGILMMLSLKALPHPRNRRNLRALRLGGMKIHQSDKQYCGDEIPTRWWWKFTWLYGRGKSRSSLDYMGEENQEAKAHHCDSVWAYWETTWAMADDWVQDDVGYISDYCIVEENFDRFMNVHIMLSEP